MELSQSWYIVKQSSGNCKIVSSELTSRDDTEITQKWGPFSSQEEAIARRIGLIRTGKCQPM
ncbi:MAG: DDE transposase family protein [Nostocales cyanobacterium 94392]|nr:DDE transposase family protein [Nostocales cyanobacterium 94392]